MIAIHKFTETCERDYLLVCYQHCVHLRYMASINWVLLMRIIVLLCGFYCMALESLLHEEYGRLHDYTLIDLILYAKTLLNFTSVFSSSYPGIIQMAFGIWSAWNFNLFVTGTCEAEVIIEGQICICKYRAHPSCFQWTGLSLLFHTLSLSKVNIYIFFLLHTDSFMKEIEEWMMKFMFCLSLMPEKKKKEVIHKYFFSEDFILSC